MKKILFLIIIGILLGFGIMYGEGKAQEIGSLVAKVDAQSKVVSLQWTSPGDDGTVGTASTYDVRFASDSATLINWTNAVQVDGEPAPKPAGSPESFPIIVPEGKWFIAIKAADEVPNWSNISNIVTVQIDTTPPGAIVDLRIQ